MNSRDYTLDRIRKALGRAAGQAPPPIPPPLIRKPEAPADELADRFCKALETLNGKTYRAASVEDARGYAERLLAGREAVASASPVLAETGIASLAGVIAGVSDRAKLRDLCATRAVGITSADYALADTGTLVMFSSAEEARMISLLPPCHLAIVPRARLLSTLDELLTLVPIPAERSSSMVLITGPSRTADIEQILVRGVHGPGEIHAVLV